MKKEKKVLRRKELLTMFKEVKNKKVLIAGISTFVVIVLIVLIAISMANKSNPFAELYIEQGRQEVHREFGKPETTAKSGANKLCDIYENVKLLGRKGYFTVYYDEENLVSGANFSYIAQPNSGNFLSDKDIVATDKYLENIVIFFSEKYGSYKSGYYCYEWNLTDGTEIVIEEVMNTNFIIRFDVIWE